MNSVIVPVDFSDTSLHAARYAAKLLMGHSEVTMILYHSFSKENDRPDAEKRLEDLRLEFVADQSLNVETLAYCEDDFVEGLDRTVRHRGVDMVIMGITGRSALGQVFIGSNTLKFSETKACPVLIIPEKSEYREIKNVMLASDFKDTLNTTPSAPIKRFLKIFTPQLHIVNVDPEHYVAITEAYDREKQQLKSMFEEFNPEFYFLRLYDVDEALNLFAEEKDIDLIISIHRNHKFLERVFKRSRTKNLSYQSNLPIFVVHE